MEWSTFTEQGKQFIKKYRFVVLILLVGIFLMSLPTERREKEMDGSMISQQEKSTEQNLQEDLEAILSQISGAGRVRVLLTLDEGEEILFQANEISSEDDTSSNIRKETVTITGTDRAQNGLVRKVIPPTYRGAVVLCQGADKSIVKLAIVEAVASVTGLSSNKITVLKMK